MQAVIGVLRAGERAPGHRGDLPDPGVISRVPVFQDIVVPMRRTIEKVAKV